MLGQSHYLQTGLFFGACGRAIRLQNGRCLVYETDGDRRGAKVRRPDGQNTTSQNLDGRG